MFPDAWRWSVATEAWLWLWSFKRDRYNAEWRTNGHHYIYYMYQHRTRQCKTAHANCHVLHAFNSVSCKSTLPNRHEVFVMVFRSVVSELCTSYVSCMWSSSVNDIQIFSCWFVKKNMYGNFIVSYERNHKDIYTDDRQRKLLTWLCGLYEDYIIDVLQW